VWCTNALLERARLRVLQDGRHTPPFCGIHCLTWTLSRQRNPEPGQSMPRCAKCEGTLVRSHRGRFQNVVYSAVFRCRKCGSQVGQFHPSLLANCRFIFSRHTRCVRCGTDRVHRMAKRDRIDGISRHPLSLLLHLVAAPLNKCPGCRLQYYDWRPPRAESE
jgi:uncharacterized protein with PIN domain